MSLGPQHCLGPELLMNKALLFLQGRFINSSTVPFIPSREGKSSTPTLRWPCSPGCLVFAGTQGQTAPACPASQGSRIPLLGDQFRISGVLTSKIFNPYKSRMKQRRTKYRHQLFKARKLQKKIVILLYKSYLGPMLGGL